MTITVADGVTFSNYPVSIDAPGPGDIYVGFADTYNLTSPSPVSYPAPLDTTVSQATELGCREQHRQRRYRQPEQR